MKQKGSALILSMMLIATIGATAFGIARLLYVDTSIATTYENGAIAYYAAESGIEEGFLRYKYNMNAEVPYKEWTLNDTEVFRTNLAEVTVSSGALGVGISPTGAPDPTKQFYDLRMGYLGTNLPEGGPFYYHDINKNGRSEAVDIFDPAYATGDYNFLHIPKDESRKFDLSNIDFSTNSLSVGFKFNEVNRSTTNSNDYTALDRPCDAMAEVKFLVNGETPMAREYKALMNYYPILCASKVGIAASKLDRSMGQSVYYININGLNNSYVPGDQDFYYSDNNILNGILNKAGATTLSSTDHVTMTIKPLYYSADVAFLTMNCNNPSTCGNDRSKIVPGPYSYITSTGYYGGITRTLSANIDRQSGTLYDLYDYVIFKGN